MTLPEIMAKADKGIRKAVVKFHPHFAAFAYSGGRKFFLKRLAESTFEPVNFNYDAHKKTLWNLNFGNPLMNAAGMFKNGEGYDLCVNQAAGAYLCGTTTYTPRKGNLRLNIKAPFAPFPHSGAAVNWMGLPNPGHAAVAKAVSVIGHKKYCPLGASLSIDPEASGKKAVEDLAEGMKLYDQAAICFMEINESCPNVAHEPLAETDENGIDMGLINRLELISSLYLKKRERLLPVIVKFSNDTLLEQVPALIDILTELGFDGINFGNTSTDYEYYKKFIDKKDEKIFNYFTSNFGGGLSGTFLKKTSFELAKKAAEEVRSKELKKEFHVIRTGGIETAGDIIESEKAGISLNQWFTGYFESFANYGNKLYAELFNSLDS